MSTFHPSQSEQIEIKTRSAVRYHDTQVSRTVLAKMERSPTFLPTYLLPACINYFNSFVARIELLIQRIYPKQ